VVPLLYPEDVGLQLHHLLSVPPLLHPTVFLLVQGHIGGQCCFLQCRCMGASWGTVFLLGSLFANIYLCSNVDASMMLATLFLCAMKFNYAFMPLMVVVQCWFFLILCRLKIML
jgi:hypothetical protein